MQHLLLNLFGIAVVQILTVTFQMFQERIFTLHNNISDRNSNLRVYFQECWKMIINDERNLALEHHLMATRPVCVWRFHCTCLWVCVCAEGSNSGKDLELPLLKEHRSACLRVRTCNNQDGVPVTLGYACLTSDMWNWLHQGLIIASE